MSDDTTEVPGHDELIYDLGTPREYTARGGWNVLCECGVPLGETGDDDLDQRWREHVASLEDA